jgi:hypothetical protein
MKIYIWLYKLWQFAFWGFLLPAAILVLTFPVVLNTIYQLESGIRASAQGELTRLEVAEIYDPELTRGIYASGKQTVLGITHSTIDYRAIVLNEFFRRNGSPLQGFGADFVAACDKYGAPFDCTTLPAIGYVETRLCNVPQSAHIQKNCWGWGGSGKNRITFKSYTEAINVITEKLVNAYGVKYMLDPKLMQKTYCGQHCNTWGGSVQSIRYEIDNLAKQMGYPALIR